MLGGKKPAAPQPQGLGEKQTIPARHGTATFVPKGHTIKIINTYGRQVVDTWAFALGAPPQDDDIDEEEKAEANEEEDATLGAMEDAKQEGTQDERGYLEEGGPEEVKEDVNETAKEEVEPSTVEDAKDKATDQAERTTEKGAEDAGQAVEESQPAIETVTEGACQTSMDAQKTTEGVADGAGQATDDARKTSENVSEEAGKTTEKVTEKVNGDGRRRTWSSYMPTLRRSKEPEAVTEKKESDDEKRDVEAKTDALTPTEAAQDTAASVQKTTDDAAKKTRWSAYVPTLPSVRSSQPKKPKAPKEQRTWASYLPSGKGFSGYNTAKSSISAFMAQHQRDPTKSVAEQLYDFSKTPVGAASLSVATGSGYAGSLYAAYRAYDQVGAAAAAPPMEYMSMHHCHASTLHLSPRIGDTLVSNLRAPIMTLIEDTSSGIHDTLIAACDPQRYKELSVEKWEEHGSCAENLVFALKELNEKSGLKGQKAIGRDVTVNMVPSPLNLFMNIPWTQEGDISFEATKCKRGDYVKFRAERDLVVVMSACPQDVLSINGGKPMVAHFVVEGGSEEDRRAAEEKDKEAQRIIEKARLRTEAEKAKTAPKATPKKAAPKKLASGSAPKPAAQPSKPKAETPKKLPTGDAQKKTEKAQSTTPAASPKAERTQRTPSVPTAKAPNSASPQQPVKKKPKKLERRTTPQTAPTTKA